MSSMNEANVLSLIDFRGLLRDFQRSDGGFHESLSQVRLPLEIGRRRVLSQARLIYLAARLGGILDDHALASQGVRAAKTLQACWAEEQDGAYCFARLDGGIVDQVVDVYAHAFVIFGFSWLSRISGDSQFAAAARQTLDFLLANTRSPEGGFVESLGGPQLPRRQNPHMHLLEAMLALIANGQDSNGQATRVANQLVDLCLAKWIQGDGTLREYFAKDWKLDARFGQIVEVGHHFEWAWLLNEAATLLQRPQLDTIGRQLYEWGQVHGWDQLFGGYYDEVTPSGAPLNSNKRIWPLCEAIKAGVRLGDPRAERDLAFLKTHYLTKGVWREHLTRDLRQVNHSLPATTPYHLLFALSEYAGV